jgi:uncharacterized Fe-S cluster-containing radical SAM superfamily protein
MYDPLQFASKLRALVTKGIRRRYYRLGRGGRWYGGIATADCSGCPLRCIYCWSDYPRDHPQRAGRFYSPEEVFQSLVNCAQRRGYSQLRISGNEPTLSPQHLFAILEMVDETGYRFILETNGILIDQEVAQTLSRYRNLHVRVSFKGTCAEEFSLLTEAIPSGFQLQMEGLKSLHQAGVSCHPAVMVSFSPEANLKNFREELSEVSPFLAQGMEEEHLIPYPHVLRRLGERGIVLNGRIYQKA